MPSCRCKYQVFDLKSKKNRLCKNKKKIFNYCHTHIYILFKAQILKIQSIYKGYYTRKKLKIFYKLPTDLQRLVIFNINKDIYLKHFNTSISKIIYKKVENFYNIWNPILCLDNMNNWILSDYSTFIDDLNYIIKIIKKYNIILDFKKNSYIEIVIQIQIFLQNLIRQIRYNWLHSLAAPMVCPIDANWIWFINL